MALQYCCHRGSSIRKMQQGGHMQSAETKWLEGKSDDENSGSAEFSEVKKNRGYYCVTNFCFLMFSCLIFESSVDRGIPSFAAAPSGPATLPLLSAKAASIICFS